MTSIEDRLRAAARAAGGTVTPGSIPPLRLPERKHRRLLPGRPHGRRASTWLAPLGAAAAVAAVVLGALTAAHGIGPGPARTGQPARADGLPPYFIREAGPTGARLVIYSSATGRAVAAAMLPGSATAVAAGGGGGRTFFAAAQGPCTPSDSSSLPCRRISKSRPYVFYRITLTATGAQVRLLPISPVPGPVLALGAAPDGSKLAIGSMRMHSSPLPSAFILTVASAVTGRERSWTTTQVGPALSLASISWLADGRRLVFRSVGSGPPPFPLLHLLDTGVPGTRQLAGVAFAPPKRAGILAERAVSPDGSTVVATVVRDPGRGGKVIIPGGSVVSFRAGTSQPARVLFTVGLHGHGRYWGCMPLWVSRTGQHVLIRCRYRPSASGASSRQVFLAGPGQAPRHLAWLDPSAGPPAFPFAMGPIPVG